MGAVCRGVAGYLGVACVCAVTAAAVAAQESGGPFTAEQVDAGRRAYAASCAACHAGDLGGGAEAPELAGTNFTSAWRQRTTKDLLQTVQGMPPDGARLPPEDYLAIAAFILQRNGARPGAQPLTEATAVRIGTIATGARPSP
jgi:alcohol dehydrogenase (cytochrome c)